MPATTLFFLLLLGGLAAKVGGSVFVSGALGVTVWGALVMAITAVMRAAFGKLV